VVTSRSAASPASGPVDRWRVAQSQGEHSVGWKTRARSCQGADDNRLALASEQRPASAPVWDRTTQGVVMADFHLEPRPVENESRLVERTEPDCWARRDVADCSLEVRSMQARAVCSPAWGAPGQYRTKPWEVVR